MPETIKFLHDLEPTSSDLLWPVLRDITVVAVMAGDIAGAGVGRTVELPGSLAVITGVDIHHSGIKVDQVVLLAAM